MESPLINDSLTSVISPPANGMTYSLGNLFASLMSQPDDIKTDLLFWLHPVSNDPCPRSLRAPSVVEATRTGFSASPAA